MFGKFRLGRGILKSKPAQLICCTRQSTKSGSIHNIHDNKNEMEIVNINSINNPFEPITVPISESSKILKHLHFTKRLDFERGLTIQEQFVKAQLEMKKIQATVNKSMKKLEVDHPGSVINPHEKMIIDNVMALKPNPVILTFEFDPVYTSGKRTNKIITKDSIRKYENFIPETEKHNPKPKFVQVQRGGQITFHGPGQMIAYLILDMVTFKNFLAKNHVAAIETAMINSLSSLPDGIDGVKLGLECKKTFNTGVWTMDNKKIASVGVHVRRSVTSHGVCINVNPDLSYLNSFIMCGLDDAKATSIKAMKPDSSVTVRDIAFKFVNEYTKLIGIDTVERIELEDLEID